MKAATDTPRAALGTPPLLLVIGSITALKSIAVLLFFRNTKTWEDAAMAINLIRTGTLFLRHLGVDNHSLQFPVYPLMVAAIYRVGGIHPTLVAFLNLLLTGLNAWVLAKLFGVLLQRVDVSGRLRWATTPILWVCVIAFLLHPFISYYAMDNVHPLSLDMLMFYAPILLVFRYFERGNRTIDLVLLGIATGMVLLTRTVLVVNLLPFVLLAASASGWRSSLLRTVQVLTIALLVGTPWLVRNYLTDGIIGYTSMTGEFLWKGSLPDSDGSNFLLDGRSVRTALSEEDRTALNGLDVAGHNQFFVRRYLETLRREPGHVAWMFAVKLKNFFWFRSLIGNAFNSAITRFVPAYEVAYAAVLGLAVLSIPSFGRSVLPVWGLIVGLGVFQSVFYVETRHRVVIEPLLIFLAVVSIANAITSRSRAALRRNS